jgi:hypothetical protein
MGEQSLPGAGMVDEQAVAHEGRSPQPALPRPGLSQ